MEQRRILKTDMSVTVICLGTMTFGIPVGEAEAVRVVHWAIDNGINFIDTANIYEGYSRYVGSAGGVAERILGKALKGRRDKVVLATKVGMKVGESAEDEGTSPAAIRTQLDRSLQRLGTDYVDIYYLHRQDAEVPLVKIVGALDEAIAEGKIKHYGISNYSMEQTAELLKVAEKNGFARPVIHQPPYSLLNRDVEKKLLPLCKKEGIAVAPYQVLGCGVLSGKYVRGGAVPSVSRVAEKPEWAPELDDELFDKIALIKAEAKEKGRTLLEHAMKEVLGSPAVVSLVVGVKRIEQLEELVAAVS